VVARVRVRVELDGARRRNRTHQVAPAPGPQVLVLLRSAKARARAGARQRRLDALPLRLHDARAPLRPAAASRVDRAGKVEDRPTPKGLAERRVGFLLQG